MRPPPALLALAAALALVSPGAASGREEGEASGEAVVPSSGTPAAIPAAADPFTFLLEVGAYYTSAGVYVPLRRGAIPHVGERGEWDIYLALLPRSFLPQFVVLEASVNPMPCLGLLVRDRTASFYRHAQLDPDVNLVRSVTAGFEEPWAASLFVGNVADFDVPGRPEFQGKGYFGTVFSVGNWHIKDNVLVDDRWLEVEAKLKGDRRSPVKKLSWSFRVGVKLHENPDVVDAAYLGIRRGRVDYLGGPKLLANAGMEYRMDVSLDGRFLKHLLLVDKKWPTGRRLALSLAVGLLWDSGRAYRGALAADARERWQLLVRPGFEL